MTEPKNIYPLPIDVNEVVLRRKPRTFEEYVSITGIDKDIIGDRAYNAIKEWFASIDIDTLKIDE